MKRTNNDNIFDNWYYPRLYYNGFLMRRNINAQNVIYKLVLKHDTKIIVNSNNDNNHFSFVLVTSPKLY